MTANTESVYLSAALRTFTLHSWPVHRQNVGGLYYARKDRAAPGYVAFGEPGLLDLTGCTPWGRHVEIEVKHPDGRRRLTPDQQDRLNMMNRCECVAWVIATADDAQAVVELAEVEHAIDERGFLDHLCQRRDVLRRRLIEAERPFRLTPEQYQRARAAEARRRLQRRAKRGRRIGGTP